MKDLILQDVSTAQGPGWEQLVMNLVSMAPSHLQILVSASVKRDGQELGATQSVQNMEKLWMDFVSVITALGGRDVFVISLAVLDFSTLTAVEEVDNIFFSKTF